MNSKELTKILKNHEMWLRGEEGGERADLRGDCLSKANLCGSDLRGVNLDFSCLPLWCGSLTMKTDERQRIQIAYHFISLIKYGFDVTEEEKKIYEYVRNYANKFHRGDVERLPSLEDIDA